MVNKLFALIRRHYDVLSYLFFGVLTTVVNYLVYLPCYNLLHISASISNVIAWVAAVAFAFVTNKPFVFQSHDWSASVVLPELTKFVGCRVGLAQLRHEGIDRAENAGVRLLDHLSACFWLRHYCSSWHSSSGLWRGSVKHSKS